MRSTRTPTFVATALAIVLAGCGGGDLGSGQSPTPTPTADHSPTTAPETPTDTPSSPAATPTDPAPTEPDPTEPEPTAPDTSNTEPSGSDLQASAGESVTLHDGDTVTIEEVRVTLVAASGPGKGCNDCPLQVELEVTDGAATEQVQLSFSGNMAPGLAEQARTATVLGWTLRADRVIDGEMDLTATRG